MVTNEASVKGRCFGNMRFSVNWYGDSDDAQLRGHHRRGEYGYSRNRPATLLSFSERFYRQCENIAYPALRPDHPGCARIDLQFAPQAQDLDIDAPIENILVNSSGLQQMFPREGPLGRFEKGQQQRILAFAQRDRIRVWVQDSSATPFEQPTAESVSASLRIASSCHPPHFLSPQHGSDACKQFSKAEGFYDVIIRAKFEADDPIDFVRAMTGRDDDRNV
jgi:hypothetical protein